MAGKKLSIGLIPLTCMTSALFLTLRNMPMMAETGAEMFFFNSITVFAFLVPAALVSAELATGWPDGGVYTWVGEAFGQKAGFVAVWLQWIQSVFGITSILSYVAASLAYLFNPALASNSYFIVAVILIVYWLSTFANLFGTRLSSIISSICVTGGVFLPGIILIVWTWSYMEKGFPLHLSLLTGHTHTVSEFIPSLTNAGDLVMFMSFIFGFAGIEVSANIANEVQNVRRTYPIAIFAAALTGFLFTLLGGLAIAVVIPRQDIDLISGAVQTFSHLSSLYHVDWLVPCLALLVALGAAGQVSTWVVGPVIGLWHAAKQGDLPLFFQRTNRFSIPHNLLFIQASFISLIGLSFLLADDVDFVFLMLTDIAVLLYSIMYCMMFAAAIRLRTKYPDVYRAYRIPWGNAGIWLVGGTGFVTMLFCFITSFIPYELGSFPVWKYEVVMIFGLFVLATIPFVILRFRSPAWRREKTGT